MSKKIIKALKETKKDKKIPLIPAEVAIKGEGTVYPVLRLPTMIVPELENVEIGQQVRMVIEGKVSAINDFLSKDVDRETKDEHSERGIDIIRVGVSEVAGALKK